MDLILIGDFARASGLTPKALRLYDEMGLLAPAEVDPVSGYRWYAADQLDRARLVARLRLVGMPLARIRVVAELPPAAAAAELRSYWRQVEADTATARDAMASLVSEISPKEHDMHTVHITASDTASHAARSGIGGRDAQLDAVLDGPEVFAVADGFGERTGVAAAAVAALGAPRTIDELDEAVRRAADAAVAVATAGGSTAPESGCTLTAVALDGDQLFLAHIGDSRAYLVREGRLERLTRDHSVVQTLIDEGRLTPDEARLDERRVQINRALAADAPPDADLAVRVTQPGDRIVLTTDGVHREVDPADLAAILVAPGTPANVADAVADAVAEAGAPDNWSVVVVDLDG
ncbi:MerR family transcriptional regulator [Nocardioides speluncae]|uniref:MerR family transcriptional regulator n=1 Tax=Nocardioides speluncae TaxID=2670337 RepID=UPI000D691D03|nr:MerR family transcriptional regulator [Nocardioides speluncae]